MTATVSPILARGAFKTNITRDEFEIPKLVF